ncbi:serine/threonine-protein kinase [Streptomyces mimosae]|uniref:serine/threonine-protein kinase n=1 Tax=Streptomyces mimosae TaxID=2586635 RepID=UPI001D0575B1|nr:serine/threonine-protein kinase [Streptomyces mimosae]
MPAKDHTSPDRIGPYTIEKPLGEGGMGRVYQGRSPGGRQVAVKVAREELAADPTFRSRFRAEVAAARRVGGFHTAQVVDADPEADPPWMVTAFVRGEPLDRLVARRGPLPEGELWALGRALAEALGAIHACGLVHRDLKPSNIMMTDDGPRVLDFGIAHAVAGATLTPTRQVVGTPGYLAPEQITHGEVGPAADVFALGAVLVRAAGGNAYGEGDALALMYRVVHDQPDLSVLPPELRQDIAACLDRDPAQRPSPAQLLSRWSNESHADADAGPTARTETAARPLHPGTALATAADGAPQARTAPPFPEAKFEAPSRKRWLMPALVGGPAWAFGVVTILATMEGINLALFLAGMVLMGLVLWFASEPRGAAAVVLDPDGILVQGWRRSKRIFLLWEDIAWLDRDPDARKRRGELPLLVRLRGGAAPLPRETQLLRKIDEHTIVILVPRRTPGGPTTTATELREATHRLSPGKPTRRL